MASQAATFVKMATVATLLLMIFTTMAESRSISVVKLSVDGFKTAKTPKLVCNAVVGVKSGDTCFAITQESEISSAFFGSINPNINCDDLFIGQWVCVDGDEVV